MAKTYVFNFLNFFNFFNFSFLRKLSYLFYCQLLDKRLVEAIYVEYDTTFACL